MWPKLIWVNLFEKQGCKDLDNVHVVSYRRAREAKRSYGVDAYSLSRVSPIHFFYNLRYLNLESFANAIIGII